METKLIKRTIFVAQCDCSKEDPFRDVRTEDPPREVMCTKCKNWVEFKEESWIGSDKLDGK